MFFFFCHEKIKKLTDTNMEVVIAVLYCKLWKMVCQFFLPYSQIVLDKTEI